MKNNYGLPYDELESIFKRDKTCVYCHKVMISHRANSKRANWHTIEHLNYLPPWNNPATVVFCCWACNSSRGNKKLRVWFKKSYCKERNINENTVTGTVRKYIKDVEDR